MTALSVDTLLILSTVLAYFIGGLPFGYWFVRIVAGQDIRTMGSGNIGATNVHRSMGAQAGVIVLVLDILKGSLAVWVAALLTQGDVWGLALAAAAVMMGHCYPVLLRFKGGKAVACFIGAFLYLTPLPLLATLLVFVLVVSLSKFISLGSIAGALVFPVLAWVIQHPALPILYAAIFSALLIVYRHKGNIARLRAGKENVFSFKGKRNKGDEK